jgi:hypothetical protein
VAEDGVVAAVAEAEDQDIDMNRLDPQTVKFTKSHSGMLDIAMPDRTVEGVHCVQMFPFSDPERYISIVRPVKPDPEEVGVIANLRDLPLDQQKLVIEDIKFRYFVPEIEEIIDVEESAGLYEMDLATERGPRRIFILNPRESISTTDDGVMLLTDVEKCRYKISSFSKLSPRSHTQFEKIIF